MKKSFFSKLFISLSVLFALTSCDNFFSGNLIQEELQELIEEANAPEVEIFIAADADTGSVAPNGIVSHKVGKSFPVIFTEAKGYQFLYWEVLDRETKAPLDGPITISDKNDSETRFLVKEYSANIFLHPVCIERPSVASYAPYYVDAGVPRDSSIIITFSKEISKDNDFSKIRITSGGESVAECYKTPVLNENVLTIAANTSNLIGVPGGTRSITVTIPKDFYYETKGSKIAVGTEISWSFNVNNTTNDKAEITFSVPNIKGKITPSDANKYSVGEVINLKFEPNDGYDFNGWNVKDGEGKDVPDTILSFENKKALSTTVTVLGKVLGVSITPESNLLPKVEKATPENIASGVIFNSQIYVKFNKSIKVSSINTSSVKISDSYKSNLYNYFDAPVPVLDANSTTTCSAFTINLNNSKINDFVKYITDSSGILDINVTLDSSIEDWENLKMAEPYTFVYRVNSITEKIKPVIESIALSKTQDGLKNVETQLVNTSYTEWTGSAITNYNKNHAKSVWIDCKATDVGSYVSDLVIKETLIEDNSKNPKNITKVTTVPYTENSCFEYSFRNSLDGLVLLQIYAKDYFGNVSDNAREYYVIKDTYIDELSVKSFRYGGPDTFWPNDNPTTTLDEINNLARRVYFYGGTITDDVWYDSNKTSFFSYLIKYSYDENFEVAYTLDYSKDETLICPNDSVGAYYFDLPATVDQTKNIYYSISLCDEALNESKVQDIIYAKPVISNFTIDGTQLFIETTVVQTSSPFIYYEKIDKSTKTSSGLLHDRMSQQGASSSFYISSVDLEQYDYRFYLQFETNYNWRGPWDGMKTDDIRCKTLGFLSDPFVPVEYSDGSNSDLIPQVTYSIDSMGINTASYKLSVKMQNQLFSQYDSVKVEYGNTTSSYLGHMNSNEQDFVLPYTSVLHSTNNGSGAKYDLTTDNLPIKKLWITGYKGNQKYTNVIPVEPYNVVDNYAPKLGNFGLVSSDAGKIYLSRNPTGNSYIAKDDLSAIEGNKIKVYFLKSKPQWAQLDTTTSLNISADEIKNSSIWTTEVDISNSGIYWIRDKYYLYSLDMPADMIDDKYVVCVSATDTAGNEICVPYTFYKKETLEMQPTVTVDGNKIPTVHYTVSNADLNGKKYGCYVGAEYFDEVEKCWKPIFDVSESETNKYFYVVDYDDTQTGFNNPFNFVLTSIKPEQKDKFMRITLAEAVYNTSEKTAEPKYGFSYAVPLYFQNTDSRGNGYVIEEFTGKLKVNSTGKCLISTVYSKDNLGDNPDNWERITKKEQHLNTEVVSNGGSYKPADNIPAGNYYTVIVHYSDGTTQMSPVKMK